MVLLQRMSSKMRGESQKNVQNGNFDFEQFKHWRLIVQNWNFEMFKMKISILNNSKLGVSIVQNRNFIFRFFLRFLDLIFLRL